MRASELTRTLLVAALLLIVCASICVPAAGALVADPDSWWVAAAGRQMLRSGGLARFNSAEWYQRVLLSKP